MLPLALAIISSYLQLLWHRLLSSRSLDFFPVPAWVHHRHNRIDVTVDAPEPRVSILLIHETFARGAKWTDTAHRSTGGLPTTIPCVRINRLLWSRDNSHTQRRRAADSVREWIASETAKKNFPDWP